MNNSGSSKKLTLLKAPAYLPVALLLLFIGLPLLGIHAASLFLNYFEKGGLDLSGEWDVCSPQEEVRDGLRKFPVVRCQWQPKYAPKGLKFPFGSEFGNWVIYRKAFQTPSWRSDVNSKCAVFIGEAGDAAEVMINDKVVGRNGDFPPHFVYSRLYPVRLEIPASELGSTTKANTLECTPKTGEFFLKFS